MTTTTTPAAIRETSPAWYDVCSEYEHLLSVPAVRYYGQLVDDAQADGGSDGFVTNSDEATDLVRALVRPYGLQDAVQVVPGEFLGDYFVLVPIPFVLPDFLSDGETWMEFETA